MDLTEQLNDYMNGLLPKSLEELYESSQQLDKTAQTNITEYQHNPDETKMKTQNEVNEGLQKVAQHIFTVSTHLNNLLSLQEQQVEKLDLEIRSALARIKGAHIRVGQAGLQKLYKERIPIEGEKTHKLPEDQIPTEYKQKTLINLKGCHLNFSALDEIGTSLTNPNQETSLIKTKNKSEKPIQEAILKSSEKKEEEKTETETETVSGSESFSPPNFSESESEDEKKENDKQENKKSRDSWKSVKTNQTFVETKDTSIVEKIKALDRKNCSIPLPFLNLSVIPPEVIVSTSPEHNDIKGALRGLSNDELDFENAQFSSNVGNVIKTFGYYKNKLENVPLNPNEAESTNRIYTDLMTTLKTIFKF
eukprot:Anaeramoba_ignava/a3854_195.p1 GENE.a3854_195~~a3854_195.p1  ORF type:complete len:364 (-),score=131.72 a3854_195:30-1121(-)